MKILITGSGFIASSIVKRLEIEGHELRVFSRSVNPIIQCRQIQGDIFNFEEFTKVLTWKPQIIIHTAWITTPGIYRNDALNLKYAGFTKNLADYVKYTNVEHLILLGSCAEYGYQVTPSIAGVTKLAPQNLYAEQKVMAMKSARASLISTQVRLTWARVFYPYGPNQDQRRLIPHIVQNLTNQHPIFLDDITSVYDWISARDVASAISWVIEHELPFELDIGTSLGYTNLEILKMAEKLLGEKCAINSDDQHKIGLSEVLVAGKESPLFKSGWEPADSLATGLEWLPVKVQISILRFLRKLEALWYST